MAYKKRYKNSQLLPSIISNFPAKNLDVGPGPRTKAQKLLGRDLGARSFWPLGPGPGPISIMAEHMCIKGNQQAINCKYMIGNKLNSDYRFSFLQKVF